MKIISKVGSIYSYTPADAPECKGATASNKAGLCITYGNTVS